VSSPNSGRTDRPELAFMITHFTQQVFGFLITLVDDFRVNRRLCLGHFYSSSFHFRLGMMIVYTIFYILSRFGLPAIRKTFSDKRLQIKILAATQLGSPLSINMQEQYSVTKHSDIRVFSRLVSYVPSTYELQITIIWTDQVDIVGDLEFQEVCAEPLPG
jgi:hypothetical protein